MGIDSFPGRDEMAIRKFKDADDYTRNFIVRSEIDKYLPGGRHFIDDALIMRCISQIAEKPADPDWKDLYARLLADFDNFKKRTARDRDDIYRYAEAEILKDILPAVDNLALALSSAKDPEDPFVKGVSMTMDSFLAALKEHGAEPFDSVGKPLDTDRMEAVAQLPDDEAEEGTVTKEIKKGWTLKGRVLRAAQVLVSAGKKESGS